MTMANAAKKLPATATKAVVGFDAVAKRMHALLTINDELQRGQEKLALGGIRESESLMSRYLFALLKFALIVQASKI